MKKVIAILSLVTISSTGFAAETSSTSDLGQIIGNTRVRCLEASGAERTKCWTEYSQLLKILESEMFDALKKMDGRQ